MDSTGDGTRGEDDGSAGAGVASDLAVGGGYPLAELARAFATATAHAEPETRDRAARKVGKWARVLEGMASGVLSIGSRRPVEGFPIWVTPEVVRGGFATGTAAAGGPLTAAEIELARVVGVPATRAHLFAHYLSERGLADLLALLDDGRYALDFAEQAALPVVALLARAGNVEAALGVLAEIEPFADRLRFAPRPTHAPPTDPGIVSRETVAGVTAALARRRPNERVEAMREALTVWNPFADELLTHWLAAPAGLLSGADPIPPPEWLRDGIALLGRYERLAADHPRCTRHRRPKENLAILRSALEVVVAGGTLDPRRRGLLRHAIDSMLRRRGAPASDPHAELRARQAADAARPTHHEVAQVVIARLTPLPPEVGITAPEEFTGPVTGAESSATGVPVGAAVPAAIGSVVGRARAATIEELIARGVVPSAEVLARLAPQIAAGTAAAAYPDPVLGRLMGAHYKAFRNRRSLLLLNLEHQVRLEELPWVRAVAPLRSPDAVRGQAGADLVRLGELAFAGFPGTILPNPLIRELSALARAAEVGVPFVEELAADIFMGRFSPKFSAAADLAAELLAGTIYQRYYDINSCRQADLDPADAKALLFGELCIRRAGGLSGGSVAENGRVIEQSQILTTHNLATLVRVGVAPPEGWQSLTRRAIQTTVRLVEQVSGNPRPLATVKDAAYAWRQAVFFLSLCAPAEQDALIAAAYADLLEKRAHVQRRMIPVLEGLRHVMAGGIVAADGTAGAGRRFLGWVVGGHWMCGR
jgi:hypothetical protein